MYFSHTHTHLYLFNYQTEDIYTYSHSELKYQHIYTKITNSSIWLGLGPSSTEVKVSARSGIGLDKNFSTGLSQNQISINSYRIQVSSSLYRTQVGISPYRTQVSTPFVHTGPR